jgi:hypothetical protein
LTTEERDRSPGVETVAGLLAAAALFLGALELVYRPFRLAPVALILVLISTVMTRRHQRLASVAIAVIGVCFVVGASLQVITHHPLY